jgi:hypothetical protein
MMTEQQEQTKRKISNYQKSRTETLQEKAYQILGNCCCTCGEQKKTRLTIDHIIACGKNRKQTVQIYLEIINNPVQSKREYQLLCRNCNWDKMIENNERKPVEEQFAYHWEIHELQLKVINLETQMKQESHKSIPVQRDSQQADVYKKHLWNLVSTLEKEAWSDSEIAKAIGTTPQNFSQMKQKAYKKLQVQDN